MLAPPWRVGALSYGESWIRPCTYFTNENFFLFIPNVIFRPETAPLSQGNGIDTTTPNGSQQTTPSTEPHLPIWLRPLGPYYTTLPPGNFKLCTPDQQVDYSLIDNACHDIKNLFLQHIVSDEERQHFINELDSYCLHRRNIYVEEMKDYCDRFINPYEFLAYYETAKKFVNETQHQLIYQFISRSVDIFTYSDLDMTNQIIPDVETLLSYRLTITPKNHQTVHVQISNRTIHNVYFHLDNSKISARITNNVFTGAGIKISSTSTDLHEPVIIENCIFQGFYFETIFEALNTKNVYLHSCVFNDSKFIIPSEEDDIESSGMLCFNSQIELHDTLFQRVSFKPVVAFENCSVAIYQITMSGNSLFSQSTTYLKLYFKYSETIIEDGKFEDNTQSYFFRVFGGNTTLHNITFSSKNVAHDIAHANVHISNISFLNSMDSTLSIRQSTVSFSSCKFINDSIIRDYDFNFMTIRDSHVSIIDTSLIKRAGTINIEGLSEIFIKGSHFLQIENSPSLILFSDRGASPESSLHMSHCRFERNVLTNYTGYSGLIDVGLGSAVIQDTVFYHNRVNMPVRGESIEFTNCIFNSNFASERGVFWVNGGTMQFSNCSFNNNEGSRSHSIVQVNEGQLTIRNCTFTNNNSPYGAGTISLELDSYLLPPANVVCEGYIFTGVCDSVNRGGMRGFIRGACMVLFGGGACMVLFGGRVWFYPGGHAWFYWGACVVLFGGRAWFYSGGACMVFPVFLDTMRYGQ